MTLCKRINRRSRRCQINVAHQVVATAKSALPARVAIAAAVVVLLTRKAKNAVAVLPILVKHKRKNSAS